MSCESGIFVSTESGSTNLRLVATQEVRYVTIHPDHYLLDSANPALAQAAAGRAVLAVVDRQVDRLYGADIRRYLQEHIDCRGYVLLDGFEGAKNWSQVQTLCDKAIEVQLPRDGIIIAIGGGVTLDIAGFVASIFRRGVGYVRVPTSLIGLVDVAVGIKQGINVGTHKSIVGSFYPAMVNLNDRTFLATLPRRHIACGVAEIIKIALVCDPELFELLEDNVEELVARCFQGSTVAQEVLVRAELAMMQQLQPNLREATLRRLPDFGHTFSPCIEAASAYSIRHGEAVAIDMMISTAIAVTQDRCGSSVLRRLRNLLVAAELPLTHEVCTVDLLMKGLNSARNHRAGDLNLVVPVAIGRGDFVQSVSRDNIEAALGCMVEGHRDYVSAAGRSWRNAP